MYPYGNASATRNEMPVSRATDGHGSNIATQDQGWRASNAVYKNLGVRSFSGSFCGICSSICSECLIMLRSGLMKPPTSHLSFTHADHQTLQRRSTAIDLNQTIPLTSSKRAGGSSLWVPFALCFPVYLHARCIESINHYGVKNPPCI